MVYTWEFPQRSAPGECQGLPGPLVHLQTPTGGIADPPVGLWDKLEATFTAQNNARRLLLRQELNSLRKAPTESISEYVARAKELATNLEAVRHKPAPSEVTLSVLAALPREFSVLVTIVGTLKETQTLDEILPALLQTEPQTRQEEELFPMYGAAVGVKSCYYCKKPGHLRANCPKLLNRLNQQCIRAVAY